MIITDNPKRLVIYFFYDKDGIVDRYVPYFLEDLKKNVTEIAIVSNGEISAEGKECLEKYGSVTIRDNTGFDVWAYKTILDKYGFEKLAWYDEVIMMNSTIMGPLYSFSETFEIMDKMDLDFWGLTEYFSYPMDPSGVCKYGYIPDHIQSHWIACRRSLIESSDFQDYWNNMDPINNYWEAVGKHEMIFTKHFSDLGYKWDLSVEMEDLRDYNGYPLMMLPSKLIDERRCPVFKRRSFFNDPIDYVGNTGGEQVIELFNYIKEKTSYNEDFIWESVLRSYSQADIVKNMNLYYVLPDEYIKPAAHDVAVRNRVALVMHLYFDDLLEESIEYAESMPKEADIYITTDTEKKKEAILKVFSKIECNKLEVRIIPNRGRDISSSLVGINDIVMDYDIVCFAHDKKTAQVIPHSVGYGFNYKCFKNVLATKEYVLNVLETFDENPRLGMLSPPEPNHGGFFPTLGKEWRSNYKGTVALAKELGLTVPIEKNKPPITAYGSMFWFRPKAMKKLYDKNWQYTDFPEEPLDIEGTLHHAIERVRSYVVQDAGYYPALVMTDKLAAIEYGNIKYYLREFNIVMMKHHIESVFENMRDELNRRLENSRYRPPVKQIIKEGIKKILRKILPKKTYKAGKKLWKSIRYPGVGIGDEEYRQKDNK